MTTNINLRQNISKDFSDSRVGIDSLKKVQQKQCEQ